MVGHTNNGAAGVLHCFPDGEIFQPCALSGVHGLLLRAFQGTGMFFNERKNMAEW